MGSAGVNVMFSKSKNCQECNCKAWFVWKPPSEIGLECQLLLDNPQEFFTRGWQSMENAAIADK